MRLVNQAVNYDKIVFNMKLGLKVASRVQDIENLQKTKAKFCEIRFVFEQADSFKPLLRYIKKAGIQPNFHFWAAFENNIMANPAAPGKLGKQTAQAIKETIRLASKYKAGYVVIHPGTTMKNILNQTTPGVQPIETITSVEEAEKILIERLKKLSRFAEEYHLELITETVTPLDPIKWMSAEGRQKTIDIGSLPLSTIEKIAQKGFPIANDFEHTACNYQSADKKTLFDFLYKKTKELEAFTKLVHLGYLIPPYNGTDFHGNLNDKQFVSDFALPNKKETIQLLKLFKSRKNLWVIPEPVTDHIGSYKISREMIKEALKF